MTHIFIATEGFPEGIENFWNKARDNLKYKLTEGSKIEIGQKAGITVREVRLWDITLKNCNKKQFLENIKPYCGLNLMEDDLGRTSDGDNGDTTKVFHGDKKPLKVGMIRRIVQSVFKLVGVKPINMQNYDSNPNGHLQEELKKFPLHGYLMVVGEIPDGIITEGRLKGRENT